MDVSVDGRQVVCEDGGVSHMKDLEEQNHDRIIRIQVRERDAAENRFSDVFDS